MIFDQWKQIIFDPYKQILFDQQKQWSFDPCKQISLINRAKYYLIDQTGAATAKDSELLRRRMKYKRAQKTKDKYGWGKIQSPKAFQWIREKNYAKTTQVYIMEYLGPCLNYVGRINCKVKIPIITWEVLTLYIKPSIILWLFCGLQQLCGKSISYFLLKTIARGIVDK